jgi:RimJ/RimL family protein N-acetyltransferase
MIETERVLLRPHAEGDFEAMHAMLSDPEVAQFIGGKPESREDAWRRLLRNAGHWALKGYGPFAIFEKRSGRYLGDTGFAQRCRGLGDQFDPYPEAAWVLTREAQGKGYASEAALAALGWLKQHYRAPRTVCIIHPDNFVSFRVAEKVGFHPFDRGDYHGDPVIMLERFDQ